MTRLSGGNSPGFGTSLFKLAKGQPVPAAGLSSEGHVARTAGVAMAGRRERLYAVVNVPANAGSHRSSLGRKRGCAGTVRPVAVDEPCRARPVGNRDRVKAVHPVPPPAVTVGKDFAVPARPARRRGTTRCGRSRTRPGSTPSRGRVRVR